MTDSMLRLTIEALKARTLTVNHHPSGEEETPAEAGADLVRHARARRASVTRALWKNRRRSSVTGGVTAAMGVHNNLDLLAEALGTWHM